MCCRSKYLILVGMHTPDWQLQGLPDDLLPDNNYASMPMVCECKPVDLSFEKNVDNSPLEADSELNVINDEIIVSFEVTGEYAG